MPSILLSFFFGSNLFFKKTYKATIWAKEPDAQKMEIMRNKNNNKQCIMFLLFVCYYTHLYDRGVYNVYIIISNKFSIFLFNYLHT